MIYRPYGRTGKQISALSAGTMRFTTPVTPAVFGDSVDVLLYAYSKGVNYFDTAPIYCDDRSEDILGEALSGMKPGTWYVATKSQASTGDDLRRHLERSLKRLRVERIHFFHIWCLMNDAMWQERKRGGALDAALRAREEGLVEHLVFSTHMTGEETARVIEEGVFEGVTLGYCAINFPYRHKGVEAAGQAGIGVVTMNPLGGGVIPRHAKRFDFIRGEKDPDVVTAALRFNLSHPAITSALVGFNNKAEVDQALRALDGFQPYPADFVAGLERRIEEQFDGLCTGCGYCLPCPKGVPIPKLMDVYNLVLLGEGNQEVRGRLAWHWDVSASDAARCDGCGACEQQCTQSLPIIERLDSVRRL